MLISIFYVVYDFFNIRSFLYVFVENWIKRSNSSFTKHLKYLLHSEIFASVFKGHWLIIGHQFARTLSLRALPPNRCCWATTSTAWVPSCWPEPSCLFSNKASSSNWKNEYDIYLSTFYFLIQFDSDFIWERFPKNTARLAMISKTIVLDYLKWLKN